MVNITKEFGIYCNILIFYNDDSSMKLTRDDCAEMSLYDHIIWSYDITWPGRVASSVARLTQEPWRRSVAGSATDSRARGPRLDTRSGHILSFLLPLIHIKKGSCHLLAT